MRRMVCRQLSDLGYVVATASHAKEALEVIAQRNDIDAVFSDVVMPGEMSGVKLAAEIATRWPKMKVLLTSGFPEAALNQANDELRARILSKPYRADELARAILELLES